MAQALPSPTDELRRQQEREREQRSRLESDADVRIPTEPPAVRGRLPQGETPCFQIERITVQTHTAQDGRPSSQQFGWLAHALAGTQQDDTPTGQCLGAKGIGLLIGRAQDALVARGFVTSRVLAQVQNLSAGTLTLTVVPGRIRRIRIAKPEQTKLAIWNNAATGPGKLLNLRDIEQTLENFKRVPTVEADIRIEPADEPDQSDLVITHHQGFPARLSLSADDSGTKATGKYQGSATFSLDNPLTLSDLFYVTFNNDLGGGDPGSRGTRGHVAHYSMPLGYWNLGATVSANRYYLAVAGSNQTYIYRGTSETAELSASRVVLRDDASKTTVTVKAFQRRSNNYIDDTEIMTQRRIVGGYEVAVGYRRTLQTTSGTSKGDGANSDSARLQANLSYRRGTGDFDTLPAPEESSGEGSSRFGLLLLETGLDVPFKAAGQSWRYTSTLRIQQNTTPLTPQDRFAIGSRYSVRGFDGETLLSAERGWTVRNELILNQPQSQQIYLGLDYGEVSGPSSDSLVGKALAGAAVGWRGSWGKLQYDFFISTPLHKPGSFKTVAITSGFVATWHL